VDGLFTQPLRLKVNIKIIEMASGIFENFIVFLCNSFVVSLYYNWLMIKMNIPEQGIFLLSNWIYDVYNTFMIGGDLVKAVAAPLKKFNDQLIVYPMKVKTHNGCGENSFVLRCERRLFKMIKA
jgi:hypothetical protein